MQRNTPMFGLDHPTAVPDDFVPGGPGDDPLLGTPGDDTIDGAAGADTMTGLGGADTYIVDNTGDVVVEAFNQGIDTVLASVSYTLAANVEHLTLTGVDAISATGNGLANRLSGNDGANTLTGLGGNDTLDGGLGDDTLLGGTGNDTYVVDSVLDVVTEVANAGVDLIQSSVSWTLGTAQDNLTLTGATGTEALNGTGNALANTLRGNAGANTLNGLSGADSMFGGAGADIYVVDNAGDAVTEFGGNGVDLVRSSLGYTLGANVENLTLTGSAGLSGTGNTLNNNLIGNSGANTLDGGAGNDTLDGGTGNDTLTGGVGNDTYVANVVTDVVIEAAGAGTDTLRAAFSTTLAADLENLTLTGTANLNGTGNAQANVINGNAGSNTLAGLDGNDTINAGAGTGIDTVTGGIGDDVITATQGFVNGEAGTDTVSVASITASVAGDATRWVIGNVAYDASSSFSEIKARVDSYAYDLQLQSTNAAGSWVTQLDIDNAESLNILQGSADNDLLMRLGTGTTYNGGAGTDTFFNDWGTRTDAITWGANGGGGSGGSVTVSNVERVLMVTGSGNDNIDMTSFASSTEISTGEGNDTALITRGRIDLQGGLGDTANLSGINASTVGTTTRWLIGNIAYDVGSDIAGIRARLAAFDYDLQIQSTDSSGNWVTQAVIRNAENLNVLQGSADDDLLFRVGNASSVDGGAGTDTFFTDWSARTDSITFGAGGGGGVNGNVSFTNIERALVYTGSGNDVIDMRPFLSTSQYYTGAGDDQVTAANGTVDAEAGFDRLDITGIDASATTTGTRWLIGNIAYDASTTAADLKARLAAFSYDLELQSTNASGNWTTQVNATGFEQLDVLQGSADDDLLFRVGEGSSYAGGAGTDTFFTDFSDRSNNITFGAGGGNGVSFTSIERLLVYTGSGNDTIDMTPFNARSEAYTGAGDDTVTITNGYVEADTGSDTLNITGIQASATVTGTRWLVGNIAYDAATDAASLKARLASFSADLELQSTDANGNWVTQVNATGFETVNVAQGSADDDLLFRVGDTASYAGGAGSDTFFSDWSARTDNLSFGATGGNGATISGFERVLLYTGAGNDTINTTPFTLRNEVYAGAGNDTITFRLGTVDGEAGSDTLNISAINDSVTGTNTRWTIGNLVYDANSSLSDIQTRLASYAYDLQLQQTNAGGSWVTQIDVNNFETVSVQQGSVGDDLLLALSTSSGGAQRGGAGTDTLYADWGSATSNIVWNNNPAATQVVNGVSISGVERLLVTTGSGNDRITNLNTTTNDEIRTGGGNDTLNGGAGSDVLTGGSGADSFEFGSLSGSDTVTDFASGSDTLRINQAGLPVGDGDTLVEGAVTIAGPGGFANTAELVVVTNNIFGGLTAAGAAAVIGSASGAYAVGQTALFVVDNGSSSALYYFSSLDGNATVDAAELSLLTTVQNTASVTTGDILFGP